jgi:hypothetical protein
VSKTAFDEALLWNEIGWSYGESAAKVSCKESIREDVVGGPGDDNRHIVDAQGFDYMAQYIYGMLEKERFKTGEVVENVTVSDDGLQVNVKTASGATYTSQ